MPERERFGTESPAPVRGPRAVALLAILSVAIVLLSMSVFQVHDYDIGNHIGRGRFQVENGRIPTTSDMTCSGVQVPMIYAEKWGFQVLVYALDRLGGTTAIILFRVGALFLLWTLVFTNARGLAGGAWLAAAASVGLAILTAEERFSDRPELVTIPMAALFALLLERERRQPTRLLWLLPILQVLWVNFHPLFPLGVALCGLFLIGGGVARWRRMATVTGLCAIACLANPDFVKGALYPFRLWLYMGDQRADYARYVTELAPPFEYEVFPTHAVFFFKVWIALLAACAIVSWRRLRLVDVLLLGACLVGSLTVRRNVAMCATLTAPLLARLAADAGRRISQWRPRLAGGVARVALSAALLVAAGDVAFQVAIGRWNAVERGHQRVGLGLNPDHLPVRAVEWMQAEGIAGNTFASRDVANYLLWKDFPRTRPWMSGDGDLSLELSARYRAIVGLRVDLDTVAREAGIESIFLRHTALETKGLIAKLAHSSRWVLVYGDDVAVVFVRRDGPYREIAARRAQAPFAPPAWDGGGTAGWGSYLEAASHFRMACLYGLFDRTDEEMTELGRALALFPQYVEALTTRGVERALEGRLDAAEEDIRAALAIKPDHIAALRNLAKIETERQNLPEAIANLQQACALNPKDSAVAFDLGTTQAQAGQSAEAVRTLEAILEQDPKNVEVHRYLASLYQHVMGDSRNAERHLKAISALAVGGR